MAYTILLQIGLTPILTLDINKLSFQENNQDMSFCLNLRNKSKHKSVMVNPYT